MKLWLIMITKPLKITYIKSIGLQYIIKLLINIMKMRKIWYQTRIFSFIWLGRKQFQLRSCCDSVMMETVGGAVVDILFSIILWSFSKYIHLFHVCTINDQRCTNLFMFLVILHHVYRHILFMVNTHLINHTLLLFVLPSVTPIWNVWQKNVISLVSSRGTINDIDGDLGTENTENHLKRLKCLNRKIN
jgi:hypothetical protein